MVACVGSCGVTKAGVCVGAGVGAGVGVLVGAPSKSSSSSSESDPQSSFRMFTFLTSVITICLSLQRSLRLLLPCSLWSPHGIEIWDGKEMAGGFASSEAASKTFSCPTS